MARVPVWTERGRSGGVRLLPGYRTDVTGPTNDEARALSVLATEGNSRRRERPSPLPHRN
jgi:predicted DNA-binding transcriptional regulator YafY